MGIVFSGTCSNSGEIGEEIARELGFDFHPVEVKTFVDTEMLVRIPLEAIKGRTLQGKQVVYVQSTAPEQAQHLIELLLTADDLGRRGAETIDLVVPYLAHARQDKEFNPGEAISNQTILKLMKNLGVSRLFTVDVHFHRQPGRFDLMGLKGYNITAAKALATYVRDNLSLNHPVIVIPDKGGKPIGILANEVLRGKVVYLNKLRKSEEDVSIIRNGKEDLTGMDAVIFDDLVSTGRTIINAVSYLKDCNARRIFLAATHTLYIGNARKEILASGVEKIVATDTIPKEDSVVKIAPVIAEELKHVRLEAPVIS